jgi:hypothetical protein
MPRLSPEAQARIKAAKLRCAENLQRDLEKIWTSIRNNYQHLSRWDTFLQNENVFFEPIRVYSVELFSAMAEEELNIASGNFSKILQKILTQVLNSASEAWPIAVEHSAAASGFESLRPLLGRSWSVAPARAMHFESRLNSALQPLVHEWERKFVERRLTAATSPNEPDANQRRKPGRRNPKYEKINQMLKKIAEARPEGHEEVFQSLDKRGTPTPNAEPFRSAEGWMAGYKQDKRGAGTWLSLNWKRLGLPAFPRGPKRSQFETRKN